MNTERVSLKDLDGLSLKEANKIPHAFYLSEWSEKGFYYIDADLGVFKLTESGKYYAAPNH